MKAFKFTISSPALIVGVTGLVFITDVTVTIEHCTSATVAKLSKMNTLYM